MNTVADNFERDVKRRNEPGRFAGVHIKPLPTLPCSDAFGCRGQLGARRKGCALELISQVPAGPFGRIGDLAGYLVIESAEACGGLVVDRFHQEAPACCRTPS